MPRRISITRGFIDEKRNLVDCFGAVRFDSFVRYLELVFGISTASALQITEQLLKRQFFVKTRYSATSIIKTDKEKRANYDNLDAFDVYLCILEEELAKDPESEVFVEKKGLPVDFVLSTTSGIIYDMIINNDRGPQKLKLLEKADRKKYKDQVTLFVFTSGTRPEELKAPSIPGKHRFAVVRRSESGRATCAASAIEGKNER